MATSSLSKLFIVFDGWDKENMDDPDEFQKIIDTISKTRCKIYISSQVQPNETFGPSPANSANIIIEYGQQRNDIRRYVHKALQKPRERLYLASGNDVITKLMGLVSQFSLNFGITSIILHAVIHAHDPADYVQKMGSLAIGPSTPIGPQLLDPANQLTRVSPVTRLIIIWLLETPSPLPLSMVKVGLPAITRHLNSLDEYPGSNSDCVPDIVRDCEPFVTIDPGNMIVQLNPEIKHRPDILRFWGAEAAQINLAIIKYAMELLADNQTSVGLYEDEQELIHLLQRHPILEQAANWPAYFRHLDIAKCDEFEEAKILVNDILNDRRRLSFAIQIYFYTKEDPARRGMTWDVFQNCVLSIKKLQIELQWGLTWATQDISLDTRGLVSGNGARLRVKGDEELTLLKIAGSRDKHELEAASLLLEMGTDPNCKDDNGRSPLHLAASSGLPKMVERLVNAGANVNLPDFDEKTPLFSVLLRSDQEEQDAITNTMILHGANVDKADIRGRRVLHVVAQSGTLDQLRMFLFLAKNKRPVDDEGKTPLQYATESGNWRARDFLQWY
ncbi:ankyrin repeat-containing domain protein [Nemania diffusa]|nr:ankyrin repeat-containing domain protein [Nemania diffusa]